MTFLSTRVRAVAALAVVVLLALGGGAAKVHAAAVNLPLQVTITSDSPDPTSLGRAVAYEVKVANTGTTNPIEGTTLTLSAASCTFQGDGSCTADSPGTATKATVDSAPFYFANDSLTCSGAGTTTASCSVGSLLPGTSKTVTIVMIAPTTAPGSASTFGAGQIATAQGAGNEKFADNPNKSAHKDTGLDTETTSFCRVDCDASFVKQGTGATIHAGSTHNVTNLTVPTVPSSVFGVGASIQNGPLQGCFPGLTCFGQQVNTNVGNGFQFTSTPLSWIFQDSAADEPAGVNVNNAQLIHHGRIVPRPAQCGDPTLDPTIYDTSGACLVVTGSPPCTTEAVVRVNKNLVMCVSSPTNGDWKFGA